MCGRVKEDIIESIIRMKRKDNRRIGTLRRKINNRHEITSERSEKIKKKLVIMGNLKSTSHKI